MTLLLPLALIGIGTTEILILVLAVILFMIVSGGLMIWFLVSVLTKKKNSQEVQIQLQELERARLDGRLPEEEYWRRRSQIPEK